MISLLVSFFVSLTEARAIWAERMSTESLQPQWAVAIFSIADECERGQLTVCNVTSGQGGWRL